MPAYYNEIDPYAAQWLRNLIAAGHIAAGDVDERSIEDVHPDDLKPYTQCHFFAGVGVWSYALRRAGWPDDRPVWTGSCPCQPFSAAGAGAGFDDQRHLWPHFHWLISERRPAVVFGEQVASKDAEPWLDLVQTDLEAMAYAFGAIAFPSAGVGAPHIRDRTYWVADANRSIGKQGRTHLRGRIAGSHAEPWPGSGSGSVLVGVGDANHSRLERHAGHGGAAGREGSQRSASETGVSGRVAYAGCELERPTRNAARPGVAGRCSEDERLANLHGDRRDQAGQRSTTPGNDGPVGDRSPTTRASKAGPVNGLWADADWLFCRDGKWRPVESGTFPLAHGATSRVGRLRAYGNAINAEAAAHFIAAYLEAL